jgi:hypothetical protein
MFENDIVDSLCAEPLSRNCSAFCDLSKQSPCHDGADSAPLIDRRLGPDGNRHGSNAAVLADQVGDDPSVLYNAELRYRNRSGLAASKATAKQNCQDGAVPLAPNRARIWYAEKLAGTCRSQPPSNADTVQPEATHLGDCRSDTHIEKTVIGCFLRESPHGSQPEIDCCWRQFLFEDHSLVAMNQCFTQNRRLLALRPCQELIQRGSIGPAAMGTREAIESQADHTFFDVGRYY